ncbi:hypothetical protein FIBSPDRAFT_904298 [Athelia psychrophila]|uniref:Uncharacterized protein n=1 Tax=Athelia psychrophila TaxID=1759441 RepID=A0A167UXQ6_9AGAM|nr:hypothetical protein FIBSPDRAFT_904298 [Fibularhizoctonia sp. CBS 109695]
MAANVIFAHLGEIGVERRRVAEKMGAGGGNDEEGLNSDSSDMQKPATVWHHGMSGKRSTVWLMSRSRSSTRLFPVDGCLGLFYIEIEHIQQCQAFDLQFYIRRYGAGLRDRVSSIKHVWATSGALQVQLKVWGEAHGNDRSPPENLKFDRPEQRP